MVSESMSKSLDELRRQIVAVEERLSRIPHAIDISVGHADGWFLGHSRIDGEPRLAVYHLDDGGDFECTWRPVMDLPVGQRVEAAKLIPDLLRAVDDNEADYVSGISETADDIAAALAEFDGVER